MGYRSDVAAVFYTAKKDDFPVIKLWLQENFPMEQFEDNIKWFQKGMVIQCDHVKWYSDYSEIQAFNEAVDQFRELFCDSVGEGVRGAYEFVRVGENYEDIEIIEDGSVEGLLSVNRSIEIDLLWGGEN